MTVTVHQTGLGYEYVRCRVGDDDSTVYIHQLVACLENDPCEVFGDEFDVHHCNHVPWDNRPENVALEKAYDHRCAHLEGRSPA